jgi:methionyl-tRNA synthetase
MSDRFYVTTPIYYPNAEPHLGSYYTTAIADVLARYHRLKGDETYFLTGTDEHGTKMAKTAAEQNITPQELVDRVSNQFREFWRELGISNDDFIRTTDQRHKKAVTQVVQKLVDSGDIYLGSYESWYDEGQEEFVTESTAKKNDYKSEISGKPLSRFKEPTYFFRLTKYVPQVLAYIKDHPEFLRPEIRRNEVISKLEQGVTDLAISRATLKWGIPLPNDPEHVVYVWIDALTNYISALGYGSDDESKFQRFWPADVHLIAKDILWFHTVYWPAMLFALGLPLPRTVYAHGYWTAEGRKMSKSLGNTVDITKLRRVIQLFGQDALRFYVLRAAPFGADLDWSNDEFKRTYAELGNVVGNLLNRVLKMTGGVVPPVGQGDDVDLNVADLVSKFAGSLANAYDRLELQQAATLPVELARAANQYIDVTQPFKMKDPAQASRKGTVLNLSTQAVYHALVGLLPILPDKARQGLEQLGVTIGNKTMGELLSTPLPAGHKLGAGSPLFPRVEEAI